RHRDDPVFYSMQAIEAIRWLESHGVSAGAGGKALELGCGHGGFGRELRVRGWEVTFADEANFLLPELRHEPFVPINLDKADLRSLGVYDLVICSNVLEHLREPRR